MQCHNYRSSTATSELTCCSSRHDMRHSPEETTDHARPTPAMTGGTTRAHANTKEAQNNESPEQRPHNRLIANKQADAAASRHHANPPTKALPRKAVPTAWGLTRPPTPAAEPTPPPWALPRKAVHTAWGLAWTPPQKGRCRERRLPQPGGQSSALQRAPP